MQGIQGLNAHQLNSILSRDPYVGPSFGGVYPRDVLPDYLPYGKHSFIVNTDPHDQPGEHWIAIHFIGHQIAEYFDSYGLPPWIYPDIYQFMKRHADRVMYNQQMYQHPRTKVCGHYCVYYLRQRHRGVPSHVLFQRLFHHPSPRRPIDPLRNDRFIWRWFRDQYRIPVPKSVRYQSCQPRQDLITPRNPNRPI